MPKYLLRRPHIIEGVLWPAWTEVGDGTPIAFALEPTPHMIAFDAAGQTALDAVLARCFGGQDVPGFQQLPPAVIPPPSNIDTPYASQDGDRLLCTMGNWTTSPTSYAYQWVRDDTTEIGGDENFYVVTPDDIGHYVTCVVTATNGMGSTEAPPSNQVFVESPVDLRRGAVFAR